MWVRILAGVCSVLAVGGFLVMSAQQAGAHVELNVVAHATNFEAVPIGGPATTNPSGVPSTGAEEILREVLLQGATTVGFDNIVCTDTFNDNGLCDVVFAFTGRGDIHGTALIRNLFNPTLNAGAGPSIFDGDIDGGTFAYANATGYVHVVALANGDLQYSFLLN